ncbi:unnamed protein product [Rotaria sordida]|uniref:EGF-like domain-containing protein n=1 Tax=Rotaria sordida TaxID=392033 RepID=A0A814WCJ2_9BILA|nr:unnamed protein product [Rotaria sordida]
MLAMSSYTWPFWLTFCCWYCVALTGGKISFLVDPSSSGGDVSSKLKVLLCMDEMKNQDETDIDCGGISCPKCEGMRSCKVNCDCISGICKDNMCAPSASCQDKVRNQDETDIDCGGSKCQKCEDSKICKDNCDCASGICTSNKICGATTSTTAATTSTTAATTTTTAYNGANAYTWGFQIQKNGNLAFNDTGGQVGVIGVNNNDGSKTNQYVYNKTVAVNVKKCTSKPKVTCVPECKNNGTCVSQNNCSCPSDYTGPTCEIQSIGLCRDNEILDKKPILLVTFGNGLSKYSQVTPDRFNFTTTYKQQFQPTTYDGSFSFINRVPNDFNNDWHTDATDHTGDPGGYMFLINADEQPGQFYNGAVNNLCIGLRYEFSVYLANIMKLTGRIKPSVRFEVRSPSLGNRLLAQLSSGDVPEDTTLTWRKYGLSFIAPSSTVVLLMISDAPGGGGNDLAIDDIALTVCSHKGSGFCPS